MNIHSLTSHAAMKNRLLAAIAIVPGFLLTSGCAVIETAAEIAIGATELILLGEQTSSPLPYSVPTSSPYRAPAYQASTKPRSVASTVPASSTYLGSNYRHCVSFEPKRFNGDYDKYVNTCNVDLTAYVCDLNPQNAGQELWSCSRYPDGINVSVPANGRSSAARLNNREIRMACKKGDFRKGIYCESI